MRTVVPLLILLTACGSSLQGKPADNDDDDTTDGDPGSDETEATEGTDEPDTTEEPGGPFEGPLALALPYAEVGEAVQDGVLTIRAEDGTPSGLKVVLSGPFDVDGDLGAMSPGEERDFTVSYTGDSDEVGGYAGSVTLSSGADQIVVKLAAMVGREGVYGAVWSDLGDAWSTTVALPSAPFPDGSASWTDDSVRIVIPKGLSVVEPAGIITHLHGHNATLATTVADQKLVEQVRWAGRDAIFVVPQGPVSAASGDFGKLMDDDGHLHLVEDVLAVAYLGGKISVATAGKQVLTSHSGGYQATAAILQKGGLPIDAVHLFDSLYGQSTVFKTFATGGGLLRSNYTSGGGTDANNEALATSLGDGGVAVAESFDDPSLHGDDVIIGYTPSSHGTCMRDTRSFGRWLVESGLPPHDQAAPDLMAVVAGSGDTEVVWRVDRGTAGKTVVIEGSDDGSIWKELGRGDSGQLSVTTKPYTRARLRGEGGELGLPSDVYGATGAAWLVVDGFDRFYGGSYSGLTHDFAATVGNALDTKFSVASNEAVAEGVVDLSDYDHVLWLLGDEGTADQTFSDLEQEALAAYVEGGGALIVSGAEVGYATSSSFLNDTLGCSYVSDDAGTTSAGGYSFGVAYPEDYPDVLSGDDVLWSYTTGGAAAVISDEDVIVVGFPLETLATGDLEDAVQELVTALP